MGGENKGLPSYCRGCQLGNMQHHSKRRMEEDQRQSTSVRVSLIFQQQGLSSKGGRPARQCSLEEDGKGRGGRKVEKKALLLPRGQTLRN